VLLLVLAVAVLPVVGATASKARAAGYSAVSAGNFYTCAIRKKDRSIVCWGDHSFGLNKPPVGSFSALSAGGRHACAIRPGDDSVACWGDGIAGDTHPPAVRFIALSAGDAQTCGIHTEDRSIICWGRSSPLAGRFSAVSAGLDYTCAIRSGDDSIACWGLELGPPAGRFRAVSVGDTDTCAIRSRDDSIACWGGDYYGLLNPPAGSFSALSVGGDHACAVRSEDNSVACWGNNFEHQSSPPSGSFEALSAGRHHTCAIRAADDLIVCWGENGSGQSTPPSGLTGFLSPVFDKRAVLTPLGGRVRFKPPWGKRFRRLTAATSIAFGATIDATRGRVEVTAATRRHATRSVRLWAGVLRLTQAGDGTPQATLTGDLRGCPAASSREPNNRRLWASARGGLRTYGRYASASPAGNQQTTWLTEDRCTSTLVRATQKTITVRNLPDHKMIRLRAGQTYIAYKP
jgi:hypothetical protein